MGNHSESVGIHIGSHHWNSEQLQEAFENGQRQSALDGQDSGVGISLKSARRDGGTQPEQKFNLFDNFPGTSAQHLENSIPGLASMVQVQEQKLVPCETMNSTSYHSMKDNSNIDPSTSMAAMEHSVIPDVNIDVPESNDVLSGEDMQEVVHRLLDVHNEHDAITEEMYLEKEPAEHQFLVNFYFIFTVKCLIRARHVQLI